MSTRIDSLSPIAAFLARHSAIVALAVFAVVGAAILDDYGMTLDDEAQWLIGSASFDYILGDEGALADRRTQQQALLRRLRSSSNRRRAPSATGGR